MKTKTFAVVIDSISTPSYSHIHGCGTVDVTWHLEDEDGNKDGYEITRVGYADCATENGLDEAKIASQVREKLGETQTLNFED